MFTAVGKTLQWPSIEGSQQKRPNSPISLSPPQSEFINNSKDPDRSTLDPLGALDEEEDEDSNSREDDQLQKVRWEQMQISLSRTKTESQDLICGSPRSRSRKSSLPKIVEDMELTIDRKLSSMCFDRDRQLELLADLDIIEEVQEWVSIDVKRRIHRQMSLPCITGKASLPPNFKRDSDLSIAANYDDDDDDDFCPPPPPLSYHETI
jgi:hypothetical protein